MCQYLRRKIKMKTEKEIQNRIDFLWERVTQIEDSISQENLRWFPNHKAISYLRKVIDESKAEIVHLSWTLI